MITILINSQKDTDFLRRAYEGLENNIVLVNPTREKAEKVLAEHPNDMAMLMGHGSPSGLFSADWRGYIIDSKNANLLQNREVIAIWCWAKEFGRREGLKGFFTSMFISNIGEYNSFFRNDRTQTHTEEEIFNGITDFVTDVNTYIKIGKPLNEWCDDLRNSADYSKNFVQYNYDGLEYFDGEQDRVCDSNYVFLNESDGDGFASIDNEMASEFIERMTQGRESCDKAFEAMHDAIKDIILNAGGFINTANNDGENDNIYSAVIDFDGTGELVEVLVKAVRVEGNEISCYIQPIYSNVKVIYTDEDMQEDEENWYLLSPSGELLYHYTILNLVDVFSFGEYLPTEE